MKKITTFMQPAYIFWPFIIIGFLTWTLLPGDYLRLTHKEELTPLRFFYIFTWYSLVTLAAWLGKATPFKIISNSDDPKKSFEIDIYFYIAVTAISLFGTSKMLIGIGGLNGIISAATELQANTLKAALYENYSAGALTLRYLAAISAAIAVYNRFQKRKGTFFIDAINIVAIMSVAFVSARLIIFQAIIFVVFLRLHTGKWTNTRKIGLPRKIITVIAVFSAIVGFTYSRSALTYKSQLGITNPVAVTLVELGRYIAMPIQVTIGVSRIATETEVVSNIKYQPMYLAPSFLHPASLKIDNSGGEGAQWYYSLIDIPKTLTTNSVFASSIGSLGNYTFIAIPLVLLFYSTIFFTTARSDDITVKLYSAVILYGFFELWRTYYLSAGSFIFFNIIFLLYIATNILLRRMKICLVRPARNI